MPDKVCIVTVAAGPPRSWRFVESVFCLRAPGEKLFRHIKGKQGVDAGHNRIIAWFLKYTTFDWMLSLDDDAVTHHETLLRLLSWDVPFVSALAFQRKPPFPPVVYTDPHPTVEGSFARPIGLVSAWIGNHTELLVPDRPIVLDPRPDDALWEVSRGGAHCCLTHRAVLEAIEPPWFARSGVRAEKGSGSDFHFHRRAVEAGFQPYVDMSVVAGHLSGDYCVGALDFAVWNTVGEWNQSGRPVGVEVIHTQSTEEKEQWLKQVVA